MTVSLTKTAKTAKTDPDPLLQHFECRSSTDLVKTDLELTCLTCGEHVCDVEPGDTLDILARTAREHLAECSTETRTVLVLSWVYWSGDEQSGGGFNWFEVEHRDHVLNEAFPGEVKSWSDTPTRIRVVEVQVPKDLTGQDLTDLLDGELHHYVEVEAPALCEHDTSPGQSAAPVAGQVTDDQSPSDSSEAKQFEMDVPVRVRVTPGNETDGRYDGDSTPSAIQSWLAPWLASYVTDHAPFGIEGVPFAAANDEADDARVTCRECSTVLPADEPCESTDDGQHEPDMVLHEPPADQPTRHIVVAATLTVPNDGYDYAVDVGGRLERVLGRMLNDRLVSSVSTGGLSPTGSGYLQDASSKWGDSPESGS